MTKEDKQLLAKDLCARLPYGVKCEIIDTEDDLHAVAELNPITLKSFWGNRLLVKPYLRPMSSMTEEEGNELLEFVVGKEGMKYFNVSDNGTIDGNDSAEQDLRNFNFHWINFDCVNTSTYIDWLNSHHFDYRDLIEKGLAIEAFINMYK